MPRLAAPDPHLPTVFTAAQAMAAGLSRDQIRQRLRTGRWVVLRAGLYRSADHLPGTDPHARARADHLHRALVAASANPGCAIGFHSAAVLHRLPLFSPLPDAVSLIVPPDHWSGREGGVNRVRAALAPQHVVRAKVLATTAVRTWFDIARTGSLADGLAVGDGGLHRGAFTMDAIRQVLVEAGTVRGCRRAAFAAGHLDGSRETALESGSFAYFIEHGLPLPRMQVEIRGVSGRLIGRVDFDWEEARVVGECDGRLKYASADVIYQEKRREDGIRATDRRMVRWGWADLWDDKLARRLGPLL